MKYLKLKVTTTRLAPKRNTSMRRFCASGKLSCPVILAFTSKKDFPCLAVSPSISFPWRRNWIFAIFFGYPNTSRPSTRAMSLVTGMAKQ